MSVEGMWCFVSGDVDGQAMEAGGVIILDTQRIYGGDSAIAHVGRYEVKGSQVVGEAESFLYNPAYQGGEDVFGQVVGEPQTTTFDLSLNKNGFLVGTLTRGEISLPIIMQKLRELP